MPESKEDIPLKEAVEALKQALGVKTPQTIYDFLSEKDVLLVKKYAQNVLKEFGRYIKTVAVVGSRKTGVGKEPSSDLDVIVIVDDTDVEKMTREEVKTRLLLMLYSIGEATEREVLGEGKKRRLHINAYLLTEWWKALLDCNPVIFTMLETGFPVVDRGFFLPLQILLRKGMIIPSRQHIDELMKTSLFLMRKAKNFLYHDVVNDLFWTVSCAVHSILMELGYKPPLPKRMAEVAEKILVEKHGILKKEHVETIREVVQLTKDLEHGKRKVVYGKELDELIQKVDDLVRRIESALEEKRRKEGVEIGWRIKPPEKIKIERPGIFKIEKRGVKEG